MSKPSKNDALVEIAQNYILAKERQNEIEGNKLLGVLQKKEALKEVLKVKKELYHQLKSNGIKSSVEVRELAASRPKITNVRHLPSSIQRTEIIIPKVKIKPSQNSQNLKIKPKTTAKKVTAKIVPEEPKKDSSALEWKAYHLGTEPQHIKIVSTQEEDPILKRERTKKKQLEVKEKLKSSAELEATLNNEETPSTSPSGRLAEFEKKVISQKPLVARFERLISGAAEFAGKIFNGENSQKGGR